MNEDLIIKLFGTGEIGALIAAFIWALIGVAISLLYEANTRDQDSARTPKKYSTWFLIKDNGIRITRTLLIIVAALVFSQQIFGFTADNWIGFCIGLGFDRIVAVIIAKVKKPKDDTPPAP